MQLAIKLVYQFLDVSSEESRLISDALRNKLNNPDKIVAAAALQDKMFKSRKSQMQAFAKSLGLDDDETETEEAK